MEAKSAEGDDPEESRDQQEQKLVNGFFCSFYNPDAMTTSINPEQVDQPVDEYRSKPEPKRPAAIKETGLSSKQTYSDIKQESKALLEQSAANTPCFTSTPSQ